MIKFAGERSYSLPLSEVAAKLSDAGFLVSCLPDAQSSVSTQDRAVWKLKPKLSFLSGSLDAVMEATSREPDKSISYRIATKAIGASSTVTTHLEFIRRGTDTIVQWSGELIEVTGLLKMVPKGLLQSTANKVIEDVWLAVDARLKGF